MILPIILAGGLGTRLRPRTYFLPKPLLPVSGRPLLWYAIQAARLATELDPVVCLDYKSDLIQSFFQDEEVTTVVHNGTTMLESFLALADQFPAEAYLCLSSDVLLPSRALDSAITAFRAAPESSLGVFAELPEYGHKKWEFLIERGRLTDVLVRETQTRAERVALIVRSEDAARVAQLLPRPVLEATLPLNLRPYQAGWTLLLKLLATNGGMNALIRPLPVHNVNTPVDLKLAAGFLAEHWHDHNIETCSGDDEHEVSSLDPRD